MKLKNVLVVYKKSSYELYAKERRDPNFLSVVRKGSQAATRFVASHRAHEASIEAVREAMKSSGIPHKFAYRSYLFDEKGYDLIVTVGGDGTFLEASHRVRETPMIGVNSSPQDSVGMFCGATGETFPKMLHAIQRNEIRPIQISRLKVKLNGKNMPVDVLNDVLLSHDNPAATSRYIIYFRKRREEQKSSGVWISSAVGSTAAIEGAGGTWMPAKSTSFQFRVREPYEIPGKPFTIKGGIMGSAEKLIFFSKMRTGRVYLDGPHLSFPFPIGSKLEISCGAPKLSVYAFNEKRRKQF